MTTQPDKGAPAAPPASPWAALERAIDHLRQIKEQQERASGGGQKGQETRG